MHNLVTPTIFSLLIAITILLLLRNTTGTPVLACPTFSCNRHRLDPIQFPFRAAPNQSHHCGYPGFDLTCNHDDTLLSLPSHSHSPFLVRAIDYTDQLVWLTDPSHCLPNRILHFNLSGSPYGSGPNANEYTFLNCSKTGSGSSLPVGCATVSCLSGGDYTAVLAFDKGAEEKLVKEMECRVIKRMVVPLWWPEFGYGYYPDDMSDVFLQLSWDVPGCGDCVLQGGYCGFVRGSGSGLDVGCFLNSGNGGLPKSAEVGLILGIGIPGVICMIVLTFYISGKVRASNQNRQRRVINTESSPAIFPQPFTLSLGLDRPTIESYPKTVLGESKRLPKPSDGTCPICLSEYQPQETLRSIPECNHYFHADCIDEWLRMNATCPLCRNSPPKSSAAARP